MAAQNGQELITYTFFGVIGSADPIPTRITLIAADDPDFTGTDTIIYYLMRGTDSGTGTYTTWTVQDNPDPNGALATALNTTPALVSSIVFGSGIVEYSWI